VSAERGAGLVGLLGGFVVFLAFLLFAVQLLVHLYATTLVTAAAHDAAGRVAGAAVDHQDPVAVAGARADAEQGARADLGGFADEVHIDWSGSDADTVVLHVRARPPRVMLGGLADDVGLGEIDRTVRVRVERAR